jgi:hypothetical protein
LISPASAQHFATEPVNSGLRGDDHRPDGKPVDEPTEPSDERSV